MTVTQTGEDRFPDGSGKTAEKFFPFAGRTALLEIAENDSRTAGEKTVQFQLHQSPVQFAHRFGDVFKKNHLSSGKAGQEAGSAQRGQGSQIAAEKFSLHFPGSADR